MVLDGFAEQILRKYCRNMCVCVTHRIFVSSIIFYILFFYILYENKIETCAIGIDWYPLVIQHSHGIDGPFIDGLPIKNIKNGDFPWQTVK